MPARLAAVFCLLFALSAAPQPTAAQGALTVFAAASLRNALDEVNGAFRKATGVQVTTSYAASSALARQIAQGAPADVYVSANVEWMDYLQKEKLIRDDTRLDLLGNALVLIAPTASSLSQVTIGPGFDIAALTGAGRIAVANTRVVPAGLYAEAALKSLGAWAAAEPRLAQAENVRATLSWVARDEAPLGIVYATDAQAEPAVKIIGVFPAASHPAIIYPVAALKEARSRSVASWLRFLRTPAAKAIFEKHGFVFLPRPAS